jgi:uncharacterized protein DUF2660
MFLFLLFLTMFLSVVFFLYKKAKLKLPPTEYMNEKNTRKAVMATPIKLTDKDSSIAKKDKKTFTKAILDPLEESWKFLTRITEQVLANFSSSEQSRILNIGKKLIESGVIYQHIVYGVTKISSVEHQKTQNKEQSTQGR